VHNIRTPRGSQVTIAELHERSYRAYADRTAVITADASITYRELGERVHGIVNGLRARGVSRGDRVVVLLDNQDEYFEIDQAIFVGGFVRVALSPRLHAAEIRHIISDCSAVVVFTTQSIVESSGLHLDDLEFVTSLVMVDSGPLTLQDLRTTRTGPSQHRLPEPYEPAALLYTSGTTGAPKGALLSHANWLAMVRSSMVELPPITAKDVVLHAAPLSHLSGYVAPGYFARGAAHVAVRKFEPGLVLNLLVEHQVTVLPMVPTILNLLVLAAESADVAYPSLRNVVYAGSPIAPDRLVRARRVFGDVFTQFYGLSEMPMPLTCLTAEDHTFDSDKPAPKRLASAGRVSTFVEVRIVGDDGHELEVGQVGEILVRSDTTMLGYWNQPDATAETLDEDGWARTGDLGQFDQEGYLYIVDRLKDMIVSGGYNVYPTEVENAIAALPAVEEVAVIGVPDETWGEAVHAFVVRRAGYDLTEADVVEACKARIAAYKKPRSVVMVDELPKTGSGKLMKRELRSTYWTGDRRVGG
jgi:acyl-CoA synthetase (AMP-forming)/AMP-acid ligase II